MRVPRCNVRRTAFAFCLLAISARAQAPASTAQAGAATTAPVYLYPLEGKLVHSFNAADLKPGDHVLTRLSHIWTDGDCTLAAGAALAGEVTGVHEWTPQDKQTRVTLQFRYICREAQRQLRLITLLAPENPDLLGIHGNPVAMQAMRSSSNGEGDPFRASGKEQGSNHYDLSGHQNPQLPLFINAEPNPDHRPTEVKRGMVWRLPGIGLAFSDGGPPSTAIVSSHRDIKLPTDTVLVLQPELPAQNVMAPPAAPASPAVKPHPQLAVLTPEITTCPAASCNGLSSIALAPAKPLQALSMRRYGHLRGKTGEIAGLEYSASLAFLGPDQLLVCVGKPGLVQRTGTQRPEDHPHLVEAVVLNRITGQVEHTATFTVPNRDRYLWPLSDGRVLVHEADRLVWYGPGLTPEHIEQLHAPLAFVHTTGNGQHLLIGTVHELHTAPEHAEIYNNDGRAPEEEVEETTYDDHFHAIAEHRVSSRAMPPLLWNTGRISLRHRSKEVWYFRETLWDGEERNFGTLTSSCVPQTSVLSGDRMLVIGCETHSLNAWARILRPDGSLVFHTLVHLNDLYPVAPDASTQNIVFVSPRLNPTANREGVLHASDITGETVRVLRTSDGHTEFATNVREPTTSAQAAAIDSTGSTLAILDGDAVNIYSLRLPTNTSLATTGSNSSANSNLPAGSTESRIPSF